MLREGSEGHLDAVLHGGNDNVLAGYLVAGARGGG